MRNRDILKCTNRPTINLICNNEINSKKDVIELHPHGTKEFASAKTGVAEVCKY